MRDYINIGSSPANEDCAQVGTDDYAVKAKRECRALIHQLRRVHGIEPEGAELRIKSFPHDFGTYYEVVCYFDEDNESATNYAFKCEELPENWDDEAKKELETKLQLEMDQHHSDCYQQ